MLAITAALSTDTNVSNKTKFPTVSRALGQGIPQKSIIKLV